MCIRDRIGSAQRHNEREKESYTNPDIIPERTSQNIHFKKPTAGYAEMFAQMEKNGVISTRGLKTDANLYGELIFDVNSAYFYNHGGYESVSYTHLDVYKRQKLDGFGVVRVPQKCSVLFRKEQARSTQGTRIASENKSLMKQEIVPPVSYTHLDVYKRQVMHRGVPISS